MFFCKKHKPYSVKPPRGENKEHRVGNENKANSINRWIMFGTLGLLVFSAYQSCLLRRNSREEDRAYVQAMPPNQIGWNDSVLTELTISIENVGKTPAYNVKEETECVTKYVTNFDSIKFTQTELNGMLGVNYPFALSADLPFPTTVKATNDFYNKKIQVFFIANITYDDIFGESHFTHICYKLCPLPHNGNMTTKEIIKAGGYTLIVPVGELTTGN